MAAPIGPGDQGSAVVRAQILLDRANYSPGEIDGYYGDNLKNTVWAFQKARRVPETGTIGADTWQALNADSTAPLQDYVIAPGDTAGPFEKIPRNMLAKAKLRSLNYESPPEALGEKFHCSPKLLAALNPGKKFDQPGETILAPNVTAPPVLPAASIVVDDTDSSVSALDASGAVIAHFPASAGSLHDPLPVGTWKILGVRWNPIFHYNPRLFWDADSRDSRANIAAGPNNPVGVVWISLSKAHYGIHGAPEPSQIGYSQSHGCIRLTNWDAAKLAGAVKRGTPAILKE